MERFTALQTFVCVVDLGSYTAAAKHLGISQPGASKAVSRLEADLGVKLLKRSTRSVTITAAGRRLHEEIRDAIAKIDGAVRAMEEDRCSAVHEGSSGSPATRLPSTPNRS